MLFADLHFLVEWVDKEGMLDVVPAKLIVCETAVEEISVGCWTECVFGKDQKSFAV